MILFSVISLIYIMYFGIKRWFIFMHLYLHFDPKKRQQVFFGELKSE